VILSLEVHCSVEGQVAMAKLLREILGGADMLPPSPSDENPLPPPEKLKRKVLVKGKMVPFVDWEDDPEDALPDNVEELAKSDKPISLSTSKEVAVSSSKEDKKEKKSKKSTKSTTSEEKEPEKAVKKEKKSTKSTTSEEKEPEKEEKKEKKSKKSTKSTTSEEKEPEKKERRNTKSEEKPTKSEEKEPEKEEKKEKKSKKSTKSEEKEPKKAASSSTAKELSECVHMKAVKFIGFEEFKSILSFYNL
jgi:hypothetical protein